MILGVSIATLLLVIALVLAARSRRSDASPESRDPDPSEINLDGSGRFHAVSIRFGPGACAASRVLHGRRFLAGTAPPLPLSGCDSNDCQCRFVHFADRRNGDDRRRPFQKGFGGSATRRNEDRRKLPDRRTDNPGVTESN